MQVLHTAVLAWSDDVKGTAVRDGSRRRGDWEGSCGVERQRWCLHFYWAVDVPTVVNNGLLFERGMRRILEGWSLLHSSAGVSGAILLSMFGGAARMCCGGLVLVWLGFLVLVCLLLS